MAGPARPRTRSGIKRAPARRTPRKAAAKSRGLTPAECRLDSLPGEAEEARGRIEKAGGLVLGAYSDPLGKNPLIVAILPIDSIIFRRPTTASSPTFCIAPGCSSTR